MNEIFGSEERHRNRMDILALAQGLGEIATNDPDYPDDETTTGGWEYD